MSTSNPSTGTPPTTDPRRTAVVRIHGLEAGHLQDHLGKRYVFVYEPGYAGPPVSLTMPVRPEPYAFESFPPFFDGLLPEGWQLEALLRQAKLDRGDLFGQLLAVGADTVGAVTVHPLDPEDAARVQTAS